MKDPIRLPRAMLFDMDGTLTRPLLDFPRIKAEMGIGERPILDPPAKDRDGIRRRHRVRNDPEVGGGAKQWLALEPGNNSDQRHSGRQ